jgi:pimeloyl-ACP methyl ester carboxylesterase
MTLLRIPGFMLDADLWRETDAALQAFAPVVDADLSQDDAVETMAARALEDASGPLIVIGFSMGGYIAREIARRAPERVQALILIATSARADTPSQTSRKAAALQNLANSHFNGVSRRAITRSLLPAHADAATIDRIQAMSQRLGRDTFMRQAGMTRASDLHRLGAIRCPTLVLAAAQDALRSLEEARELQAGIPGAILQVIEGSGHMLPIEAPATVLCAIISFLEVEQGSGDPSLNEVFE